MTCTLAAWLKAHDLGEFESVLVENQVDLKTLEILTESDLRELGLPFGPRKRMVRAIRDLQQHGSPASEERAGPDGSKAPGERRQLTVMFCDLVGSTALSTELDPEELHALVQTYRKACGRVVDRYDGHVAQYLGDGLLVYFGWPRAYEDAAERGVRSALDIVRAVKAIRAERPLAVRIGLTTGTVVVGENPDQDNAEAKLAVGQAPNVAARLLALAQPNEVVLSAATRRLLGDAFSFKDLGTHELKGIEKPVNAWRVDALRRVEGRFDAAHAGQRLTTWVGRDAELGFLLRHWEQASRGRGQVVMINGEPGIGKSRLCHVLRERIPEPHTVLRYQCSPHYTHSAFYPILAQLEFAADFTREDPPEQKLAKFEALLAGDATQVAESAQLIAPLLSLPTHRYPSLNLSPQRQKEKTLQALAGQVEALARSRPVLMVFEDVHWVDPTTQELLESLVLGIGEQPILLVATHRPEYPVPWAGQPNVTCLTLPRFARETALDFVRAITGGRSLPPQVLEKILSHTDGVPLFVEELTKSVLESGLLCEAGDRYALQGALPSLAIPTSLRDSLAARLDRLAPVKEIAQIGACIGREFSYELLARVAAVKGRQLDAALDRLVEAELITRRSTASGLVYTFTHALVQDAAYDLLLKSRRHQMHAQIAEVLKTDFGADVASKPELLAHHYTEAGRFADAIPLWHRAGTLAIERVAMREAVAHLQKALELTQQLQASAEREASELAIREQLNAAWTGLHGWAAKEISSNATAILELAGSRHNVRSLLLGLWWMWTNTITQGRIADSLSWAQRLLDETGETDDLGLRMFGPAAAMVTNFFLGRLPESNTHAERVLSLYEPRYAEEWIQLTGHDLRTFVGVYSCQWIWMEGRVDEAVRVSERSYAHAREIGHAFNLVWALTFGAYVFAYRREPEHLLQRIAEADRLAREQGLTFINEVSFPQAKGIAKLQQGNAQEAIPLLRQGIENWTNAGGGVRVPYLKSVLAEALAAEGDPSRALEEINACIQQIERPGYEERIWLPEALRIKGWILMQLNRDTEAESPLRAALDCARRQGTRSWELRCAQTLARLLERRGEFVGAREVLEQVCVGFPDEQDTPDLRAARECLQGLFS